MSNDDIGVKLIGIGEAAEAIRCMVAEPDEEVTPAQAIHAQELSLTEALDSFPYDSASEQSLGDLNKARELMGQAWQLVSKATGREANTASEGGAATA